MQFQIPQFIDTEDKIAGPLTLKQLGYLVSAGLLSFTIYWFFAFWLWLLLTIILAVISISFSFVKFNGQPLIKITIAGLNFLIRPHVYLWRREDIINIVEDNVLAERKSLSSFGLSMPAVKKLWSDLITTKNPLPKREKNISISVSKENFSVFRKLTGEREVAKRVDYR
ncbi:hypothetical protein COV23_00385 [Candidatus Wolfebacteria bacterium CG10_big_fil_rev_8_21_14_0_10_31_9]|uniref:Uncharacterized protein n=1 Tax=Candidatus Wolfebacteria bacterium CG10_big_fil_rev_8_21_14_0_10_31_9 TaxID=1975070 RepID=A0A2H0RD87_9BACT|nr:MAG: hypothetical protein COV23_00385 [Candidatus Wolfebacteria bacterium CG10_big_fil_rev_8_21_14_0_10_31_9]